MALVSSKARDAVAAARSSAASAVVPIGACIDCEDTASAMGRGKARATDLARTATKGYLQCSV